MGMTVKAGSLAIVQFLHDNRSEGYTAQSVAEAVAHQDFDMLTFLHANQTEVYRRFEYYGSFAQDKLSPQYLETLG
uniref:Uncharacterized protein n=1 Tax=Globisporangium ultimum (strain ATCC 200006 / CBS 805.95 / DAOM BR144) TaxID=431595 RepID=K3WZW9_GLOUD